METTGFDRHVAELDTSAARARALDPVESAVEVIEQYMLFRRYLIAVILSDKIQLIAQTGAATRRVH